MFNPVLLLQAWKYYHYYTLGLTVYHGINTGGKAVTYTGQALFAINSLVRGNPRRRMDDQIVEIINNEKRKDPLVIKDDWELL